MVHVNTPGSPDYIFRITEVVEGIELNPCTLPWPSIEQIVDIESVIAFRVLTKTTLKEGFKFLFVTTYNQKSSNLFGDSKPIPVKLDLVSEIFEERGWRAIRGFWLENYT